METEREELRWVDPGNGTPGWRIGCDEEIGACNHRFTCGAGDGPRFFRGLVETPWRRWEASSRK